MVSNEHSLLEGIEETASRPARTAGDRRGLVAKTALAVLGAAAIVVLVLNLAGGPDPASVEFQAAKIRIVCSETGEEWTVARGQMERELLMRRGPIDPEVGLPSPANAGRPTGFPADPAVWRDSVERVNREKEIARSIRGG